MNRLKIFVILFLGWAIVFSVNACQEQAPDKDKAELRERINETIDELKDAGEDLQEDLKQAEEAGNQARIAKVTEQVGTLDSLRNELQMKLNEVETTSIKDWQLFYENAEETIGDAKAAINEARLDLEEWPMDPDLSEIK